MADHPVRVLCGDRRHRARAVDTERGECFEIALNAGASSSPPMLRIATPVADPLLRSSNFDCSQVRVPSAEANVARVKTAQNVIVCRRIFSWHLGLVGLCGEKSD